MAYIPYPEGIGVLRHSYKEEIAMKVCPSCKGQYDENTKFCRKYGVSLVTDNASTPNFIYI